MGHTPGPWTYGKHSKEIYANGISICRVFPGMFCSSHAPDVSTQEANIRLLTAAPLLLEALKAQEQHDEKNHPFNDIPKSRADYLDRENRRARNRSAIAAANS